MPKIKLTTDDKNAMPISMHKIIHRLALVLLICVTPFSIANFVLGDFLVGGLIFIICCCIFYISFNMNSQRQYKGNIAFFVLMPIAYFLMYNLLVDRGIIGILWCFPTLVVVNFIMQQRQALISNTLLIVILSPEILSQFDPSFALRIYGTLITVGALSSLFVNVIMDQQNKLHKLAITDPLTGLLNRLTLEEHISLAIEQHNRTVTPMTLASIDIDHFKLINDQHGHDVGDKVLIKIAELLATRTRNVDKVYRLGGEEFLVVLFNANLQNARAFANNVQQELSKLDFEYDITPTLSIGLAEVDKEKTWEEWLKHADENLYQAKESGRNQVIS